MGTEGTRLSTDMATHTKEKALALLKQDAEKILKLISVQMDHLTMPQCPLYEEVLDTQMFGLSREIDFAIRLGLISEETGKQILSELEQRLAQLHEAYEQQNGKGS
ncbi:UPF0358 protein [Caldalkalibacillus thermarum TA2.A1]|uniref:UPF0358 protein CathTA2_2861 n=2 Tax=Caldalkalibacillus TaxID=379065 RepID=F5LAC6_CALTT|nr:UPF0358 protein [Caldalkalibacillus thermarum TA2.A1]